MKSLAGQSRQGPGRRSLRERKISQRLSVVDELTKQQVAQARLDALENDKAEPQEQFGVDSEDDEFVLQDEEDEEIGGNRRRRKGASKAKKFRSVLNDRRGPKTFARLLEEANLDPSPGAVNYLTAAVGPPKTYAPRRFCTVCGTVSKYTCVRCGSRYCCKKCFAVHAETRCLKFLG